MDKPRLSRLEEWMGLAQSSITTTVLNCSDKEWAANVVRLMPLARSRIADILYCLKVNLNVFNMNRLATWLAACENGGAWSETLSGWKVIHSAWGSCGSWEADQGILPSSWVLDARHSGRILLRRGCKGGASEYTYRSQVAWWGQGQEQGCASVLCSFLVV